jgi:hypothetical protein
MNKIVTLIIFLILSFNSIAQNSGLIQILINEKNRIESCYSQLYNDTLIIGNAFIERRFKWNNGNIISIEIRNKMLNKIIPIKNDLIPDFSIDGLEAQKNKNHYSSKIVEASPIVPAYLNTEIITIYDGVQVKRNFRIFPSSMGISCEYHLKLTDKNIIIRSENINVEHLLLPSMHWEMEAIEFFDNTDNHNNLVKKERIIPYKENYYVANLLYMNSLTEASGLYILKEAPCSSIQINYPGYDFITKTNTTRSYVELQSVGLGIEESDLTIGEWVKCYSYTIGIHNNTDFEKKMALRSYQNNTRILRSDRDEMVMVNTWGDRNRDANIEEKFILKELLKAHKFGFTHYMIDDGWQEGLSMNSAQKGERLWDQWSLKDWQPNKQRFPNGLDNIIERADSLNIDMGLWFHPSNENEYANWEQDADILIGLYNQFGINYIKIDGVKLPTKKADINLRLFFDRVLEKTNYQIVFSLDATADNRYGYHYNSDLGNIFLENRYTDWKTYYPYKTLRNAWMLSAYVPMQKIQVEFLNKWRNVDTYKNDPFAPANYSFDYLFAITIPGQPLAWFETTGLPQEAEKSTAWFHKFNSIRHELHNAYIFPIGNEPNGNSFTGFQFIISDTEGYILVFREFIKKNKYNLSTMFTAGQNVDFRKIYGDGFDFKAVADDEGKILFKLNDINSFCLYKYKL